MINLNKEILKKTNLFSKIEFLPTGTAQIQSLYRKTQSELTATFKFEKKASFISSTDTVSFDTGIVIKL